MSEEHAFKEVAKALGLKNLAPQIYKDLLQPAAQEVGRSLVTVAKSVTIAISPLAATVWGFEKIREWLSTTLTAKLAKKNPGRIQTPPLNIAGPVLMNLPFAEEEPDLKEMYANLLATAMDKDHSSLAHPSFVYVIQQLSADEATLIKYVAENSKEIVFVSEELSDAKHGDLLSESKFAQYESLCRDAGVQYVDLASSYVENLLRLRIFAQELQTEVDYKEEEANQYGVWGANVNQRYREVVYMSEYGWNFAKACIEGNT